MKEVCLTDIQPISWYQNKINKMILPNKSYSLKLPMWSTRQCNDAVQSPWWAWDLHFRCFLHKRFL